MTGKVIAYVLSIFAFFAGFLMCISFFMYMATYERINDICYDAAETVSTKGLLSREIFDYVKSSFSGYGDYDISLVLEKNIDKDKSVYLYGEDQICGVALSTGDRMTIYATNKNPSLFEKITGNDMPLSTVKVAVVN